MEQSFSSNGQPAITRTDRSLFAGQRAALSNGDLIGAEWLYGTPFEIGRAAGGAGGRNLERDAPRHVGCITFRMRRSSTRRRGAAQTRERRGAGAAKPRASGIQKPVQPDEALAEIVGRRAQARTDMIKRIWKYIKAHRLQDPSDGRVIRPDGVLGRVLGGKRRVSMFEIARYLNQHLASKS